MFKVLCKKIIHKISLILNKPVAFFEARQFYHYLLKTKKDDEIFLCVSALIGDCTFSLSYMNEIHKKWSNKKIVVYLYGNPQVTELYPFISEVRTITSKEQGKELIAFMQSNHFSEKGFKKNIYSVNPFYLNATKHAKNQQALTMIKTHIFRLPDSAQFQYHASPKWIGDISIPDFYKNKDHIAIINPYSNSLSRFASLYYEEIAKILQERGYIVYTNVIKDQLPIKGTERLNCSLPELYAICTQIPLIVSIRSGVLDYLIPTDINMFVISENGNRQLFFSLYDLNQWKPKGKIDQIIIDDGILMAEAEIEKNKNLIVKKFNKFCSLISPTEYSEQREMF